MIDDENFASSKMTAPINLDTWQSIAKNLPYGDEWMQIITGEELLNWQFPMPRQQQHIKVIFDTPHERNVRIININDIPSLDNIPPQTTIETALELIKASSPEGTTRTRSGKAIAEPWGICLGKEYIPVNAIQYFAKIYNVKNFTYGLKTMSVWLKTVGKMEDASFTNWFLEILQSAGPMTRQFPITNSIDVSITSLLTLSGESWLDENILRCLITLFEREYDNGDQNLFIPPLVIDS